MSRSLSSGGHEMGTPGIGHSVCLRGMKQWEVTMESWWEELVWTWVRSTVRVPPCREGAAGITQQEKVTFFGTCVPATMLLPCTLAHSLAPHILVECQLCARHCFGCWICSRDQVPALPELTSSSGQVGENKPRSKRSSDLGKVTQLVKGQGRTQIGSF